jgi:4-hydroxy-4-methyl-2-oxoglutarate aldolase
LETKALEVALSRSDLDRLGRFGTCAVSNAIEKLGVRLRNEGYMSGAVRCYTPDLPSMLGYAVTGTVRTSTAPVAGTYYHTNMSWWQYVKTIPAPRVLVLQDADAKPGSGALWGELNAAIGMALGCVGVVTNGAIHDLPQLRDMAFQTFASSVTVSHAYAHVAKFGESVEVGGLNIAPGELVHGDLHGVHTIPLTFARELIAATEEVLRREREFVEFCQSPEFSLQKLSQRLDEVFREGLA